MLGLRPRLAFLAFSAIGAVPAIAQAGEGLRVEEHRPATWDDNDEQLRAQGLGQSRGNPVVLDETRGLDSGPRPQSDRPEAAVIFLNFDGAELISGPDDARSNVTTITDMAGAYPAYGDNGAKRQAVIQAVREDWSAYNAVITDQRPSGGEYVMAMIGPGNPSNDSTLGLAVLDCEDANTRNNVVFAFHSGSDAHTTTSTATTISQEIGHSFGLEHVDEASDIMNPTNVGGDPSFRDDCLPLSKGDIQCTAQHSRECGLEDQQNAHRELYQVLGPATPDASGPSIRLLSPLDGEDFDIDEAFEIVIEAEDGVTVHKAALFVNTLLEDTDDAAPFGWTARQSVSGKYDIRVEIQDTQGLIRVSNTATITVGRTAPAGDGSGVLPPPGYGVSTEPAGCSCTAQSDSGRSFLWALVPLFGVARRRAACRRHSR